MARSGRRKRLKAYPCPYCTSSFDSEEGINRHIAHSPQCYAKREQDAKRIASAALHQDPDDPEGYESDNSETHRQLHFLSGDELEAYLDIHEPVPPVLTAKILKGNKPEEEEEEEEDPELLAGEDGGGMEEGYSDAIDVGEASASSSELLKPFVEIFEGAAKVLRAEKTRFEVQAKSEKAKIGNKVPWGTLHDEGHFELAEWLLKSGISRAKMDSFLKLGIVSSSST